MSNESAIRLLLAAVGCLATGAALAQQPVSPGQIFRGGMLDVRTPNSDGWLVAQANGSGMAFGRSGKGKGESYIANVMLFAVPETQNPDEFVALIKHGMEADIPPDRYTIRISEFKYTEERSYPCVRATTVAEDHRAQASPTTHEVLLLQLHSLYCRHPRRAGTGFMISYSHRGVALDDQLDQAARDFIDGVRVPTTPGEL